MSGPTGLPEGPKSKWLLPWYAVKFLAVCTWGLIGAAAEATRDAVRRKR